MTLRSPGVRVEYQSSGLLSAGMDSLLMYNPDEKWDGTSRLVIPLHGHGGGANGWVPVHTFAGRHAAALVRTGRYIVLAIAAAGAAAWGNPAAQAEIAQAVTYARNRGAKAGKYGVLGYSMGGLTASIHCKNNQASIAGCMEWAPANDLDWAYSTAGYAPPYGLSNNAARTAEIDAAYGSYAATAGSRIMDEAATTFHNLTCPIRIIHATDDSVVPYGIATRFVTLANNPLITLRQPDILGDHTNQFQNIPDAETVAFYDSLSW
jgi:pimeloyl-ACP methyl ester carboxylesterase